MANRGTGKVEVVTDFLLGSKITVDGDCSHEIRRHLLLGRRAMTNLDSVLKSRRYSADKGPYGQGNGLASGHVWLSQLDCKEGGAPKNWFIWTVVLEKTPESPLDSKEIKPVNLKRNQPWILVGRIDAEAEAPVFWSSDANSWLTEVLDAGKNWGQKEKRISEDEVAGWHHWCSGHELGQTLGDSKGRGGLHAVVHSVAKSQTQLRNWIIMNNNFQMCKNLMFVPRSGKQF